MSKYAISFNVFFKKFSKTTISLFEMSSKLFINIFWKSELLSFITTAFGTFVFLIPKMVDLNYYRAPNVDFCKAVVWSYFYMIEVSSMIVTINTF